MEDAHFVQLSSAIADLAHAVGVGFAGVDARLDRAETAIVEVQGELRGVNVRLDRVDTGLERLKKSVDEIKTELRGVNVRLDRLERPRYR